MNVLKQLPTEKEIDMKTSAKLLLASLASFAIAPTVWADDVEGPVESIDTEAKTLVVEGITFHLTEETEFEDIENFEAITVGQEVEVDYDERDGVHYAEEIEPED